MDEKDLEVLKKLAEMPNITKAAQELFTTQPSLTKRIQRIEAELGCQLFVRSKKGLLPMPSLENIMPKIGQALSVLSEIRDEAAVFSGKIAGTLKIGASINFAHYKLPRILKNYVQKYPQVRISLWVNQSSIIYQCLQKGELSLAVLRGDYPWDEGDILFSREPVCLVRNHRSAPLPLNAQSYIDRKTDPGLEGQFTRWRIEQGLLNSDLRNHLTVNDISTCLAMVRQDIGWALLPSICLENFDGIKEPLAFKDGTLFTRATHLLYRENSAKLPQVRAFIEEIMGDVATPKC